MVAKRFVVCAALCAAAMGCGSDVQYGVVSPVRDDPATQMYAPGEAASADGLGLGQVPAYEPAAVPGDVPGRYALVEVDGRALPTVVSSEGDATRELTAGRLTMEPDGTWLFRYDFHDRGPAGERVGSDGDAGIYRIEMSEPIVVQLVDVETGDVQAGSMASRREFRAMFDGRAYRFIKTDAQ